MFGVGFKLNSVRGRLKRLFALTGTYDFDWVKNTFSPAVVMNYGAYSATDTFRQYGFYTHSFVSNEDGTTTGVDGGLIRRSTKGLCTFLYRNNYAWWNRDLNNAVWVKTNVTAVRNIPGTNGEANAASQVTATAAGGTILQTITEASKPFFTTAFVRRITGSGTVEMTMDNVTWTPLTFTGSWSRVQIPGQTLANPIVGFRFATSGDAIGVDLVQVEDNTYPSEPYATTGGITYGNTDRVSDEVSRATGMAVLMQGDYDFYWEGNTYRTFDAGIFVSDGGPICSVGAAGEVALGSGAGATVVSGTGQWKSGIANINKVAGYLKGTELCIAVNGSDPVCIYNAGPAPSLTHFDLGTNGNGARSIEGYCRRFIINGPRAITPADLKAKTA